jgi:hypothetical protein
VDGERGAPSTSRCYPGEMNNPFAEASSPLSSPST